MDSLPIELHYEIINHFEFDTLRKSCSICKSWHDYININLRCGICGHFESFRWLRVRNGKTIHRYCDYELRHFNSFTRLLDTLYI